MSEAGLASGHDAGWERAGAVEPRHGVVALADLGTLGESFLIRRDDIVTTGAPRGLEGSIVMEAVAVRGSLPVEVYVEEDDSVSAVRIVISPGLDLTDGRWLETGELHLMRGQCVAGDPRRKGDGARLGLRVRTGRYTAERLVATDAGPEDAPAAVLAAEPLELVAHAFQVRIQGRRRPGERRREGP